MLQATMIHPRNHPELAERAAVFSKVKHVLAATSFKHEVTLACPSTGQRWFVRAGKAREDKFRPEWRQLNDYFVDRRLNMTTFCLKLTVAVKTIDQFYEDDGALNIVRTVAGALSKSPLFMWLLVKVVSRDGKWRLSGWYNGRWMSDTFNIVDLDVEHRFISRLAESTGDVCYNKYQSWDRHAIGLAQQYAAHGIYM